MDEFLWLSAMSSIDISLYKSTANDGEDRDTFLTLDLKIRIGYLKIGGG